MNIFLEYLEKTGYTQFSNIYNEKEEEVFDKLMNDKRIIKKELKNGIVSFNFSRDVFFKKDWDEMSVKARGLFYNKNLKKIIARSYDKFFNIGEMESFETTVEKIKYPVNVYHKYNGFLGILGYNPSQTEDYGLFVASKSTDDSDFSRIFNSILKKKILKKEKMLSQFLADNNASIVFEVIDPQADPHIIKYKNSDIIMLDVIHNEPSFRKFNFNVLKQTAKHFNIPVKEAVAVLNNKTELMNFYAEIEKSDFMLNGQPVEGFVFEDSNGFQVKFKTGFYNFWKKMRGLADKVNKIKESFSPKIKNMIHGLSVSELIQKASEAQNEINQINKSLGQEKRNITKEENQKIKENKQLIEKINQIKTINDSLDPKSSQFLDFTLKQDDLNNYSIIELRDQFENSQTVSKVPSLNNPVRNSSNVLNMSSAAPKKSKKPDDISLGNVKGLKSDGNIEIDNTVFDAENTKEENEFIEKWNGSFQEACDLWSKFANLQTPIYITSKNEKIYREFKDAIALILLDSRRIVISYEQIKKMGMEEFSKEIIAHEVGHHMRYPSDLIHHGKLLGRMRRALLEFGDRSPRILNMFQDILINDKLQTEDGLNMSGIYEKMTENAAKNSPTGKPEFDPLWQFYMRTFEILWDKHGKLTPPVIPEVEFQAKTAADLIMNTGSDIIINSAGKYASIVHKILSLPEQQEAEQKQGQGKGQKGQKGQKGEGQGGGGGGGFDPFDDMSNPGTGDPGDPNDKGADIPWGIDEIEDDEEDQIGHPEEDKVMDEVRKELEEKFGKKGKGQGEGEEESEGKGKAKDSKNSKGQKNKEGNGEGQSRDPLTVEKILKDMGIKVDLDDVTAYAYIQKALPYLVKYPEVKNYEYEKEFQGYEPWNIGDDITEIDMFRSLRDIPILIPGYNTYKKHYETGNAGREIKGEGPPWLDIYVDCSGSMPNPQAELSHLALAGAIIALSALRVGAKVQATLWSGNQEYKTTGGFISDREKIMKVICGYIGGSTAFPLNILKDTYLNKEWKESGKKAHILHISDDGIDTMLSNYGRTPGIEISKESLEAAGGGGTMALQLHNVKDKKDALNMRGLKELNQAGYDIYPVNDWSQLTAFARGFAEKTYGSK